MTNAPQKPKARLPRGLADRGAGDAAATARMLDAIAKTYRLYGFEPVETPLIEYSDALGKFLPDQDRPNEGVFSFQDDDEQWLSLRYDLTAPLARYVAENYEALPKPYRSYRAGYVFRNEKPGPGRFRQFMQFDADTVGAASPAADAEMCMMLADTLEAVGIKRGDYVVKVNNRKVLDGVMEAVGLGGEDKAGQRVAVLRAIDKLDRLGFAGVRALLGAGRKDESGDYTRGAGLGLEAIEHVIAFIRQPIHEEPTSFPPGPGDGLRRRTVQADYEANLDAWGRRVAGTAAEQGIKDLRQMGRLFDAAGYSDRIEITAEVVRGLEYYTGPVYEAELTFEVPNDQGQPVRLGSVAGGGRYDGLVARFLGQPVPATGFSIGVSRLLAALKATNSPLVGGAGTAGPVVVLVMDGDRIADYQRLTATLRNAGIRAEMYLGASGMKAQMKYADRRGSPCVVIQGSDERERGSVQIKDLIEGARAAGSMATRAEYASARPAQFEAPEADMVARVREVLGAHGLGGGAT